MRDISAKINPVSQDIDMAMRAEDGVNQDDDEEET